MNKTIFITGAAKRIGKEIALTFNSTDLDVIVALKQLYGAVDNLEKYKKMKELESSLK